MSAPEEEVVHLPGALTDPQCNQSKAFQDVKKGAKKLDSYQIVQSIQGQSTDDRLQKTHYVSLYE